MNGGALHISNKYSNHWEEQDPLIQTSQKRYIYYIETNIKHLQWLE